MSAVLYVMGLCLHNSDRNSIGRRPSFTERYPHISIRLLSITPRHRLLSSYDCNSVVLITHKQSQVTTKPTSGRSIDLFRWWHYNFGCNKSGEGTLWDYNWRWREPEAWFCCWRLQVQNGVGGLRDPTCSTESLKKVQKQYHRTTKARTNDPRPLI